MTRKYPIDYVPETSRLIFIKIVSAYKKATALYHCICGKEKIVTTYSVASGKTKSCGCWNKERTVESHYKHGKCDHPIYKSWRRMLTRCYYKKAREYRYYGAKGVSVCDEWRYSFITYYNWAIAAGWQEGLIIDKDILSKEKGVPALLYSPDFCKVVTWQENNLNKSTSFKINWQGVTKNGCEWEKILSLPDGILAHRINGCGWPVEKAMTTPVIRRGSYKKKREQLSAAI